MASPCLCSSSTTFIILVFFQVFCAHFITETSVKIIPINNQINMKFHHHVNDMVEVALLDMLIAFLIDKNTVIITNNDKKLINESFSLHPKYVINKFLNFVLKFHQIKTTKQSSTTTIVQTKFPLNSLYFNISHDHKDVILIIGAINISKHNKMVYHKKIESCILNLLSFCLIFNNF